jgi:hypothetical protein
VTFIGKIAPTRRRNTILLFKINNLINDPNSGTDFANNLADCIDTRKIAVAPASARASIKGSKND